LVLYLASLGRASLTERWATIQSWAPDTAGHVPSEVHGRSVFERNCMMCHGAEGKGDGDLSGLFFRPAMNLANGPFLYVPSTLPDAEQQVALSRIVKFGLVGFHMPGHETMDDRDVVDVVAYVRTLAAKDAR
jgi:mono/diheme cytochrome c family protein